jgi:peptidyl-prolyl cis-trans isomerase SurA
MMKKLLFLLIAISSLVLPALAQEDTVVEEIVARVNNAIITRADLRRNREQTTQEARDSNLSKQQLDAREANSLRDLIDQQLLTQKAVDLGISADADLVKRLDDIRKEMKAGSMEDLQKMAESQGVSWEEFKQNTKNSILTQKVIGSEVGGHIQIPREEIQKFYDEHKAEISQPERVRLSEILIANNPNAPKPEPGKESRLQEPTSEQVAAAEAKANEIYQQLKGGTRFDDLARKLSNGSTAEQGGDLGYFKRNDLAKELEDKSFSLKTGEFTEPIRTRQGFIILRVADHIQAGTPPLDSVREQIQEQLYSQRIQPALREYLTKLREDAYIDIKPGYTDSGASPNQTKLVYTSDSGPKTKQVRGKLGVGKKKTVVVVAKTNAKTLAKGSTSELGTAKADVDAKEKAANDKKAAEAAAAAKAQADAAEKEKLSHMSKKERERYLSEKKREARKESKADRKEARLEKKQASKLAKEKAAEAKRKAAEANGKAPTPKKDATTQSSDTTAASDQSAPPKKKKISWF